MTPEERAWTPVGFAVICGLVGGWLFTPLSLFVLPIVYFWCVRRYTRRQND